MSCEEEFRKAGLDFNIIEAIDGNELKLPHDNFSSIKYSLLHGKKSNLGELGCYLSHLKVLKTFIESEENYALVCEDDIKIDSEIKEIVDKALNSDIDFDLLVKSAKVAHIYSFIKNTEKGFKTMVGERGILLSGGQRQRIAIARAIYKSRKVLVLDEATSALDAITEEKILKSIVNMDKDLTIIMVTHRTSTLNKCNRVFRVIDKKIIEEKRVL